MAEHAPLNRIFSTASPPSNPSTSATTAPDAPPAQPTSPTAASPTPAKPSANSTAQTPMANPSVSPSFQPAPLLLWAPSHEIPSTQPSSLVAASLTELKNPAVGETEEGIGTGAVAQGHRDERIQGSHRQMGWIGIFLGRRGLGGG